MAWSSDTSPLRSAPRRHGSSSARRAIRSTFAAAGGYLFFFLLHTFASDRRGTRVLVLGYGALALSVALEVVEPRLVASGWTIRGFGAYEYTQVVEEYCEVLGPALLVLTLGRVPHVAPEP